MSVSCRRNLGEDATHGLVELKDLVDGHLERGWKLQQPQCVASGRSVKHNDVIIHAIH